MQYIYWWGRKVTDWTNRTEAFHVKSHSALKNIVNTGVLGFVFVGFPSTTAITVHLSPNSLWDLNALPSVALPWTRLWALRIVNPNLPHSCRATKSEISTQVVKGCYNLEAILNAWDNCQELSPGVRLFPAWFVSPQSYQEVTIFLTTSSATIPWQVLTIPVLWEVDQAQVYPGVDCSGLCSVLWYHTGSGKHLIASENNNNKEHTSALTPQLGSSWLSEKL